MSSVRCCLAAPGQLGGLLAEALPTITVAEAVSLPAVLATVSEMVLLPAELKLVV